MARLGDVRRTDAWQIAFTLGTRRIVEDAAAVFYGSWSKRALGGRLCWRQSAALRGIELASTRRCKALIRTPRPCLVAKRGDKKRLVSFLRISSRACCCRSTSTSFGLGSPRQSLSISSVIISLWFLSTRADTRSAIGTNYVFLPPSS